MNAHLALKFGWLLGCPNAPVPGFKKTDNTTTASVVLRWKANAPAPTQAPSRSPLDPKVELQFPSAGFRAQLFVRVCGFGNGVGVRVQVHGAIERAGCQRYEIPHCLAPAEPRGKRVQLTVVRTVERFHEIERRAFLGGSRRDHCDRHEHCFDDRLNRCDHGLPAIGEREPRGDPLIGADNADRRIRRNPRPGRRVGVEHFEPHMVVVASAKDGKTRAARCDLAVCVRLAIIARRLDVDFALAAAPLRPKGPYGQRD